MGEGRLSGAEQLARSLPPSVSLVKAFNTLELADLLGDKTLVRDVPVCGDNPSARVLVTTLIALLGHRALDTGELSNARRIENLVIISELC